MTSTGLFIPHEYGWNLFVAVVIAFQCVFQGFHISRLRGRLFTKNFFAKHFPEIKEPPRNGYPDMGSGMFSAKLPYNDWVKFNNYQRAHLNYVENVAAAILFELVAGIFYPKFALLVGVVYIFGRFLFGIGYRTAAVLRAPGAISMDVALVLLLGAALFGAYTFAGGYAALVALAKF